MTKKLTDKDYDELAADYAANPLTEADIAGPVVNTGVTLKMGRPVNGSKPGKTPSTTVRLPEDIRSELGRRATEGVSASEIVRRALVEHFATHPA